MKAQLVLLFLLKFTLFGTACAQTELISAIVEQQAGSVILPSATTDSPTHESADQQPLYTSGDVLLYLPAPANLATGNTASGRSLEFIILGPRLSLGQQYDVIPIGLMEFEENNSLIQQVLSIPANPAFQTIKSPSLEQLQFNYPGVIEILSIWFENAYSYRQSEFLGVKDEKAALELLR